MYVSPQQMFLPGPRKFLKDPADLGKTRPPKRHKGCMTANHLAPGHWFSDGPSVDVVTWRLCRLLESGFAEDLALRLASTPAVDVHALLQLVDRGCPPELAARILSPLGTTVETAAATSVAASVAGSAGTSAGTSAGPPAGTP
jgi:hypothetical protein